MNWFQENRFLGTFLAALAGGTLLSLIFLWWARSGFEEAKMQFDQQATELATLQRHNPFPSEANLKKVKNQAEEYATAVAAFKEEVKTHALPAPAEMKPNEFQTRLRQAMTSVMEKARANKVKLPDNFFLGFEEFGAALPDTEAAPLLGQQLAQVELLVDLLIDARVDAITSLKRVPAVPATTLAASPTPTARGAQPVAAAPLVEKAGIDLAFTGSPGATRRALNQISTSEQQIFVIRTLHILNEKDTGPPREGEGAAAAQPAPSANTTATGALNFIVGNEHLQTSARIEMVRFTF